MNEIDARLILSQFFESLRQNNIIPRDSDFVPILDGNLHRFALEGDKGSATTGAYIIHTDGCPVWHIQDFRQGNQMIKCVFDMSVMPRDSRPQFSPEEYRRMQAENERRKQEQQKLQQEKHRIAAIRAWNEFDSALSLKFTDSHSYLKHKHVDNFTSCDIQLKVKHKPTNDNEICRIGDLLVPVLDAATDRFVSLIHVADKPDSEGKYLKPFFNDTTYSGACVELIPYGFREWFCIQPDSNIINPDINADTVYLCEGFATGYSVLEITEYKAPVLCACSCHNLLAVCKAWCSRYSEMRIVIAADHDKAGITAAQKCINEGYAQSMTIPPIEGDDWNDALNRMKGFIS